MQQATAGCLSALAVLQGSGVIWQHHGGGPGPLWGQVNQGSEQKQSTAAGDGWGNPVKFGIMVLLCCSDISLILCLVLPLDPSPPSCLLLAPAPQLMAAARALLP